eukprot:TRINITY_DN6166_c0_g1_i6.p1 TRINITY_DN6166_c0_g1~~TRINITY_DN6166_c0_g1_i6.p1  ORF type:complete len:219 (+),score=45.74 TRINITY_DN6166_c0_g1_i6:93-749(+)
MGNQPCCGQPNESSTEIAGHQVTAEELEKSNTDTPTYTDPEIEDRVAVPRPPPPEGWSSVPVPVQQPAKAPPATTAPIQQPVPAPPAMTDGAGGVVITRVTNPVQQPAKAPPATTAPIQQPVPAPPAMTDGAGGVVITFETKKKEQKNILFKKRPLGLGLSKSLPLVVNNVLEGKHAKELGVEEGWVMTMIKGAKLPDTFKDAKQTLAEATEVLPMTG